MTVVQIVAVYTVCSDFVELMVENYRNRTVLDSDFRDAAIGKACLGLFRQSGGANIPVVRCFPVQAVPDAAAYHVCFKSVLT